MKHVTFIGLGEIGTAIAGVIQPHATIRAWDKDQSKVPAGSPATIEEAARGAEVIFLCVPSWVIRGVAEQIRPLVSSECVVISLAKGLEQETLKTMGEVLQESFPQEQPTGVLGGPLLAEELRNGLPGIGVIGSAQPAVHDALDVLFQGTNVRIEHAQDVRTVAIASVLKNIYAVGLGVADGLGWGWNAKGWLSAMALQEMGEITRIIGGDASVMMGSAGAGDFLATSLSSDSRNRETGKEIARTGSCPTPSEGCRAIMPVLALIRADSSPVLFLQTLHSIINQHADPATSFQRLFAST